MASKSTRNRAKFACLDCGMDTGKSHEFYFVNTQLWLSVVGSTSGMLCVGCLEKRIGRKLVASDFPDVSINRPGLGRRHSNKLINRITKSI